jgi:glycine cleavage system H protein
METARMSEVPAGLYYSPEHEYLKPTEDAAEFLVGITDYAQGELGDVVFLEFPEVGERFGAKEVFGTIEAVKAVSDLYTPVAGEIVEVNAALEGDPSLVNVDPYGEGWMVRLRVDDADGLEELLDAEGYVALIDS